MQYCMVLGLYQVTVPPVTAPTAAVDIDAPSVAAAPVASSPVTAAPVAAAPVADSPVNAAPVAAAPVAASPVTAAPVAASPLAASPVAAAPVAASSVTAAPVAASPVAASPVTAAPVAAAPKESIPVAHIAWRSGTTNIFLLGSQPPIYCSKISALYYVPHCPTILSGTQIWLTVPFLSSAPRSGFVPGRYWSPHTHTHPSVPPSLCPSIPPPPLYLCCRGRSV